MSLLLIGFSARTTPALNLVKKGFVTSRVKIEKRGMVLTELARIAVQSSHLKLVVPMR
jgi:hypothetical protein